MRRRFFSSYKPPAIDSTRAVANARLLLVGARSVDDFTVAELAHTCRLKPKTAEYMLEQERKRRAGNAL